MTAKEVSLRESGKIVPSYYNYYYIGYDFPGFKKQTDPITTLPGPYQTMILF